MLFCSSRPLEYCEIFDLVHNNSCDYSSDNCKAEGDQDGQELAQSLFMKMVRIITKVAVVMTRMEVMEPNALCCQIHDCLSPQMHQSINNRITLLKKENARKKVFFISSPLDTGDLKLIANMMTNLSPRGSPGCHLREDLVKAEKHFILFNVHRSLSLSFSVCDIISICANFYQSYSAHIVCSSDNANGHHHIIQHRQRL